MRRIFFFSLFLLVAFPVCAQLPTQQELEARKAKIQEEILEKQALLKNVRSQEKSVVNQLMVQKEKIGLQEKLIRTTEKQTKLLGNDIYINQLKINHLHRELDTLKNDYADMIRKSYKSRSKHSRVMFVLSSKNFAQAYRRMQYMKQYASYRKMQAEEIVVKAKELEKFNQVIGVQKDEKEKLLVEKEKERATLEVEKQEQERIAQQIKKEKVKIVAELKKKQKESKAIDQQIQRLIRAAIAEANRKTAAAKVKASPKTVTASETKAVETATKIVLTPEGQTLSDNLRANKGRLPWPVEKGAISLRYGDQPHPLFPTLIIHNSGLEITTDEGANARAVFNGEVTLVQVLSPVNKAVFIQHGDYFTIYQNLSKVFVAKGDKVSTKQAIGQIRTNGDTGKTILKFLLLQNTSYFDPSQWLFNR